MARKFGRRDAISDGLDAMTLAGPGGVAAQVDVVEHGSLSELLDDDHTQYLLATTAAGAGLTVAGRVLAVGQGDGVSVGADAVAVDTTVARRNAANTFTAVPQTIQLAADNVTVLRFDPADVDSKFWNWNIGVVPQTGRDNVVLNYGYNNAPGGGPADSGDAAFYLQFESHYNPASDPLFEYHLNAYTASGSASTRPFHINVYKDNLDTDIVFRTDTWSIEGRQSPNFQAQLITIGTNAATSQIINFAPNYMRVDGAALVIKKADDTSRIAFDSTTPAIQFVNVDGHIDSDTTGKYLYFSNWAGFLLGTKLSIYDSGSIDSTSILTIARAADQKQLTITGHSTQTNPLVNLIRNDGNTNAAAVMIQLDVNTTGTAAAGLGGRLLFKIENSSGALVNAAAIDAIWHTASGKADIVLSAFDSGNSYEVLRLRANSAAPQVGFFTHTPQGLPAAYTLTGSATRVFPTDPSSAYTGINNAQAGTPYAQVTDLNTLRGVVSTLLGVVRQIQTDLAGYGLLA